MNLKTLGQRLVMFDGLKSWSVENAPEYAWTRNNLRADDASFGVSMAYRAVGAVFRGVQLRANAVARMPRYIYRGSEVVPEDDPSLDFIGNLTDLLWRVEASLCLYAASYLWKARNTVRLRELRWFATNTITPDVDPSAGLRGFRRSVGNILKCPLLASTVRGVGFAIGTESQRIPMPLYRTCVCPGSKSSVRLAHSHAVLRARA